MPKNYKPKTSNKINDNAPKQPNDFKNHVNKYKYSQPHTNNNYGKIMNMNMPPYSNVPYYYPQQMNINQGYPNIIKDILIIINLVDLIFKTFKIL